jgi:hypothetical protein
MPEMLFASYYTDCRIAGKAPNPDSYDIRVVERGGSLSFANDALVRLSVGSRVGRQKLDRNLTIKPGVFCEVDLTHPSVPRRERMQ